MLQLLAEDPRGLWVTHHSERTPHDADGRCANKEHAMDGGVVTSVSMPAGVMGVVVNGGEVRPGDTIRAELPLDPH